MRVSIKVRGRQPTIQKTAGTPWRLAIRDKVLEQFPSGTPAFTPPPGTRFKVQVEFHLVRGLLSAQEKYPPPPDLDNLLIPILNTLFHESKAGEPTGVLVNSDDNNVFELCATKTEASTLGQQGANIVVTWMDRVDSDP